MKTKARIFGRLREQNNFVSLFLCSCGYKEWIVETEENPKEISCSNCEEEYLLKKQGNSHYMILEDDGSQ